MSDDAPRARPDPSPPSSRETERPALAHVPATSPARADIERCLALLAALRREFEATDWFDQAMFVQRVDPLIDRAEQTLQVIQQQDPGYDVGPLRTRLWQYMQQRLQDFSTASYPSDTCESDTDP